ncbi:MAG TPA: alpha/beta hydrolase [Kribbella sp.]|uniref:alpha/beta fold hydrolase n=1 Tax=Kribbella sp. TaxID=1871183 RepID=UPI002D784947|nr:alpha/beta hydrolase [Kribbella sp.]HET6294728.1 alpha/beta hydrolase [Kribbella sp.]
MPVIETSDACTMYYSEECHADPWGPEPETVLLVHGMAESSRSWTAWVPHLSRRYRVVRVDLPGFDRSTVDIETYDFSIASLATELANFLAVTGWESAHIVGAKLGGSISLDFASRFPERTRSVTALTGPLWAEGNGRISHQPDIPGKVTAAGTEQWAGETMGYRLGSGVSDAQREWWAKLMGATNKDLVARAASHNAGLDLRPRLALIRAKALMITSQASTLANGPSRDLWNAEVHDNYGFLVLPVDGYHVAAAVPDLCADIVAAFIGGASPTELAQLDLHA